VTLGYASYVETIHVGYEIAGEMAAVAYARADYGEVALGLSEEVESDLLVDATDLTWRTLPVTAFVRRTDDLPVFEMLAADACDRIRSRAHDVHRDNEFFVKSAKERRHNRFSLLLRRKQGRRSPAPIHAQDCPVCLASQRFSSRYSTFQSFTFSFLDRPAVPWECHLDSLERREQTAHAAT
jgi:hypothetical protein